LRPMTGA